MYIRKWLNDEKDGGVAFVSINAETGRNGIEANIDIGDCNRKVSLDFFCYGKDSAEVKRDIKKRMKKLKILIDSLNKLYAFFEEELNKE